MKPSIREKSVSNENSSNASKKSDTENNAKKDHISSEKRNTDYLEHLNEQIPNLTKLPNQLIHDDLAKSALTTAGLHANHPPNILVVNKVFKVH